MSKLPQLEPTFDMRRKGKIVINASLLYTCDPEARKALFSKLIIVRAEHLAICDKLEYYAYCEDFRPVGEAERCPKYTVIITKNIETGEFDKIAFEEIGYVK